MFIILEIFKSIIKLDEHIIKYSLKSPLRPPSVFVGTSLFQNIPDSHPLFLSNNENPRISNENLRTAIERGIDNQLSG